ncbi:ATP-dependent RNA helicase RhlE [Streptomyces purpurascens]
MTTEIAARDGRVLLFLDTKHGVDLLTRHLRASGVAAAALHSGKSQPQRTRTLSQFKNGQVTALVATNVAARGLHVDDLDLVVNVDPATDPKDYLHRAGRTARAGRSGTVVTLVLSGQRRETSQVMADADVAPRVSKVRSGEAELSRITGAKAPSGKLLDGGSAVPRPRTTTPRSAAWAAPRTRRATPGGRPSARAARPASSRRPARRPGCGAAAETDFPNCRAVSSSTLLDGMPGPENSSRCPGGCRRAARQWVLKASHRVRTSRSRGHRCGVRSARSERRCGCTPTRRQMPGWQIQGLPPGVRSRRVDNAGCVPGPRHLPHRRGDAAGALVRLATPPPDLIPDQPLPASSSYSPAAVPLTSLVRVAGSRWRPLACDQAGAGRSHGHPIPRRRPSGRPGRGRCRSSRSAGEANASDVTAPARTSRTRRAACFLLTAPEDEGTMTRRRTARHRLQAPSTTAVDRDLHA